MEKNIRIGDIINFIYEAMDLNLKVVFFKAFGNCFRVYNNDGEMIQFNIDSELISIQSYDNNGYVEIKNTLSERHKLLLNALILDVKEYNENKAIESYHNFLKEKSKDSKSIDIDDLNDED